jgi:hypothetical protein
MIWRIRALFAVQTVQLQTAKQCKSKLGEEPNLQRSLGFGTQQQRTWFLVCGCVVVVVVVRLYSAWVGEQGGSSSLCKHLVNAIASRYMSIHFSSGLLGSRPPATGPYYIVSHTADRNLVSGVWCARNK